MTSFRMAVQEDADALLDLTLRAYKPIRDLGIQFAAATADLSLVRQNIRDHLCFVAEEDHRIVATLSVRMPWGPKPGPLGVPHIWWFAADPDSPVKGCGAKLLTWCEEVFVRDTLKSPYVSLGTAQEHPWLMEMYQRRGYEVVSAKASGRGHTSVCMRKNLQSHPDTPG